MKKHQIGTPKKCSRREFAKSATAVLAAAPFAASEVSRGRDEPLNYSLSNQEPQKPMVKISTDHIPPIVISDGSFSIECEHELKFVNSGGPSARPHVYAAAGIAYNKQYGDVAIVEVVTEFEERFTLDRTVFPPGYNPQLKIWLQESPFSGNPAADPNVLIRGNYLQAGKKTLRVEMRDKKLGTTREIDKKRRGYRCEHDDNSSMTKKFRIRKWQVVDAGGRPIPTDGFENDAVNSGATKYLFMVAFYEP